MTATGRLTCPHSLSASPFSCGIQTHCSGADSRLDGNSILPSAICNLKWLGPDQRSAKVNLVLWPHLQSSSVPPQRPRPCWGTGPWSGGAMSPGCMLLFVFGFVGGAVVINSAVLVSLSVLLLVHYSVSTGGLPALPSLPSLPRPSRYYVCVYVYCLYVCKPGVIYVFCSHAVTVLLPCRCVTVRWYETAH